MQQRGLKAAAAAAAAAAAGLGGKGGAGGDEGGGKAAAAPFGAARPPSGGQGWAVPGIRVRLVGLDAASAAPGLRLRKGVVLHPGSRTRPGGVRIRLDPPPGDPAAGPTVVESVPEAGLETVLPRAAGTACLVVRGGHRGRRALLVEKRGRAGEAAVRWRDPGRGETEVATVLLDDVAEWAGG